MKNDGLFYSVAIGIFILVMTGAVFAVFSGSHVTSSDVQPVKVVAIDGESIALESSTTRYNLYSSGGAVPKVGTTVNLRISTYRLGGHGYSIDGYSNISANKPSNDTDDSMPVYMPMPGFN